jgi:hypothetical protein
VTDYWDLRCLKTILRNFFTPSALVDGMVIKYLVSVWTSICKFIAIKTSAHEVCCTGQNVDVEYGFKHKIAVMSYIFYMIFLV